MNPNGQRWFAWLTPELRDRLRRRGQFILRAAALLLVVLLVAPVQAAGRQNVQVVWSNDTPLGGYLLGDFNGDGRTDLFRANGSQWQYAASGAGMWQNLASDTTAIYDLRLGDFNGDGRTDVFSRTTTGQWRYSAGGANPWQNLASEPATSLNDLRFGDFDGNGRTDVFRVNGTQWQFSPDGTGGWQPLAADPTPLADLRFGFFDGDDRMDVFSRAPNGQWRFSSGGANNWTDLASDPASLADLRFGDFNGDDITDVFHRDANGQWRYSPSSTGAWQPLASDPAALADLRFGDFDGDGRTDIFNISNGQARYSSAAMQAWQPLNPGGQATPTPTSIPPDFSGEIAFGDFDGDRRTDVFRSVNGQWQFSSGGVGSWQNLATDPLPLYELRFYDFNGDRRTDVFSVAPDGRWRYSDGGTSAWINLAIDNLPVGDLRFGDFNGDGRTDVFSRANTGQWRYSDAGNSAWINLAIEPATPLSELRFGDFNGDGRTDVFRSTGGQWQYSSGGVGNWQNLAFDPTPLTELAFGDFDNDRRTDVFRTTNGQWQYSPGGAENWRNLATDPLPLSALRFGDFNGDGRTDVFSIASDGRWRYSDGGTSAWILLGPPSVSPTPTFTPTPTPTGFPTSGPTPGNCTDILGNGEFEFDANWTFGQSPAPGKYTGEQRRGGLRAVQLGIPPGAAVQESFSSVRQLVNIPRNASTVTLRWWHIHRTEEGPNPNPSGQQDRHDVILLSPQLQTLAVLDRVRGNENSWQPSSKDLTEFVGQSFYIYFNAYNDGNPARTWMFLDSVTLEVCTSPWGQPQPYAGPQGYANPQGVGGGPPQDQAIYGDYGQPPAGQPQGHPQAPDKGRPPEQMATPTPPPTSIPPSTPTSLPTATATATPTFIPTATSSFTCSCDANTLNCENFQTQNDAQACHNYCQAAGRGDIHDLDRDNDGLACEALPPMFGFEEDISGFSATVQPSIQPSPLSTPISALSTPIPASAGIALADVPAECVELLQNGDFEATGLGWEAISGASEPVYATEITFNHSGQALRLGNTDGQNVAGISAARQDVALPEAATSIVLSFRYYPLYEDVPGPGDLQYVDIYNATTGQFAGRALGAQSNERAWLTTDFDLTSLAGQTLRLVFAVNNDGVEGRTALYVDNVSVVACNFRNLVSPGIVGTSIPFPAARELFATPANPLTVELPAAREPLTDESQNPRAWMARLGAVGMMIGVLGMIGFVALVIMGAVRRRT